MSRESFASNRYGIISTNRSLAEVPPAAVEAPVDQALTALPQEVQYLSFRGFCRKALNTSPGDGPELYGERLHL